jgi:type I restriction enzyme S subunit
MFKDYIRRIAVGATMPSLNTNLLSNISVIVPPLPEQRAIAGILSALDDKIELNRLLNATLESMARTVFRQWFVENEEAGKWEEVPLPEIIEVNPSRSLKKGEIAPYLDMANMPTQGHRGIEWIDRPFGSGTKFINGDTLLARITPCLENGKTAFVDFLKDGQAGWGSTEYIVFRPKPPLPPEYGYYLARSEELRSHAIQNMTGTSGRQRTPASCFDSYMIAKPPSELANRFGGFAKSVIEKIKANDEESRTLASLRDALLPKLMRGEVRVKEVEENK